MTETNDFEVTDTDLSNLRWHAFVKLPDMAGAIRDSNFADRPGRIAALRRALDRIEELDAEIERRKQET